MRLRKPYSDKLRGLVHDELLSLADESGVLPKGTFQTVRDKVLDTFLKDRGFLETYLSSMVEAAIGKKIHDEVSANTGMWGAGPLSLMGSMAYERQSKESRLTQEAWSISYRDNPTLGEWRKRCDDVARIKEELKAREVAM